MPPTSYPDINDLLADLLADIQAVLGDKLTGLYLYGSLVWGDFDHDISDIDLLAALESDLDEADAARLERMHADFAHRNPRWEGRIEVQYYARLGLKTFRDQPRRMGNISPGEPFHLIEAGREWLLNWYFVQDYGVTLYGPPPAALIDPISQDEFVQGVREHALTWREHIRVTEGDPPYQSYAVLTLCRALYTHRTGAQVSKDRAARWAAEQFPGWAEIIQNALTWRKDPAHNPSTYPETARFVHFMIDQIVGPA